MKLDEIVKKIQTLGTKNFNNVEVAGISIDSKSIKENEIFVCIKGENADGHSFAQDAKKNKACAIVCEHFIDNLNIPQIKVASTHQSLVEIANIFYQNPTKNLKVIAVTGTNGKTTVSHLIQNIFEKNGKTCALIGTLGYKFSASNFYYQTGNTTPQAHLLQKIFYDIKEQGTEFVSMEVSSHAIAQNRIGGTKFKCAVFTNLTLDHLDYHITMKNYFETKAKLFASLEDGSFAIINNDDAYSQKFIERLSKNVNLMTFGTDENSDVYAKEIKHTAKGTNFVCVLKKQKLEVPISMQLSGMFNVYNALSAICVALSFGLDIFAIKNSLEECQNVSGRFEVVNQNPVVIVDYAHTPDGLKNLLNAAKELKKNEDDKLICLFGCGGDRDATKRPQMAKIADEIADKIIITSDNPRTEDPNVIISDILSGIKTIDQSRIFVEVDRKNAIKLIKKIAKPNDIAVVAGKGHENYQILKNKTIHFDDKEIVQEVFA